MDPTSDIATTYQTLQPAIIKRRNKRKLKVLTAQKFKCAICRRALVPHKTLNTSASEVAQYDHCHISGQYAGVLCINCNTGLGNFHDSPETLRRAAIYLEFYR